MKTIIAGSRNLNSPEILEKAIAASCFVITEVVCGGANGIDELGRRWGNRIGIPVKMFPADWNRWQKAAGPIRNRDMALYADALIAVWDGKSKGTANMIAQGKLRGLKVYVHRV